MSKERTEKTKWSALDTIFVLFVSITILLLLFWISFQVVGKDSFSNLPAWANSMGNKWWTFVTTGASSLLTYWLKRNKKDTPNYLKGIGVCTASLLLLLIVIKLIFIPPQPPPPDPAFAKIRFKLDYPNAPKNITIRQRQPTFEDDENLTLQADGWFQERIHVPKLNKRYYAEIAPTVSLSNLSDTAGTEPMKLRFIRKAIKISETDILAFLRCDKVMFKRDEGDPGYIELVKREAPSYSFPFFTSAFAQETQKRNYGWAIPNLATLQTQKKTGYSEITIESIVLNPIIESSDRYTYSIKVNGTPIYIDGLLPKYVVKKFNYKEGLKLTFGLENLKFGGTIDGYEQVDVVLNFLKGAEPIKDAEVSLRFSALRNNPLQELSLNDGSQFHWNADYKPSSNNTEIFYSSSKDVRRIKKAKQSLEKDALRYNNCKVVGVIRPPLADNANYGLVLGLLQPNNEIKFLYNLKEAKQFSDYLKNRGKSTYMYTLRD